MESFWLKRIFLEFCRNKSPSYASSYQVMNIKKFNADLIDLAEKRIHINSLDYSDEAYDEAEDKLHEAEDAFLTQYGDYLEDVLDDIHEKHCSGTDVLIATAYLAKNYVRMGESIDGDPIYEIKAKEGVIVEADKYPGKVTRLVIVPAPARIIMTVNGKAKDVLWTLGNN